MSVKVAPAVPGGDHRHSAEDSVVWVGRIDGDHVVVPALGESATQVEGIGETRA